MLLVSEKLENVLEIDNWKIREFIGKGAYANAYELENGEPLVLKWMLPNPGDKNAEKRFINEIAVLKLLDHVSIPKFHGEGTFDGRPYIVMSKAPGKILRKILHERQSEGQGTTLGELRVLAILRKILEALAYMHKQGVHHRDLKDDNILSNNSDTQLTIIDFGVCEGSNLPESIHTFRDGVGSAKFSPPSKIESGISLASHDIFAVGVIGYLLLTGFHPWEVPSHQNIHHLSALMKSRPPKPVFESNASVSKNVSDLISKLIVVEDEFRPLAEEALRLISRIEEEISDRVTQKVVSNSRITYPHVTLDPIHKDIRLTDFEWKIINSREFQRLRLIKQLGFTNLVYSGAEHTRFAHAIGTMHVTNSILTNIEERGETSFRNEERLTARCYALVHDVAHIAFGHTLEDELNFFNRHDENSSRLFKLVFSEKSELGTLLRSTEYGREVLKYFDTGNFSDSNSWVGEIVESPFGSDVLDYVDRDSFYCGLDHKVDSAIFRRLSIKNHSKMNVQDRRFLTKLHGLHGYRLDADFAIESILRERYALFMKVYTHPVKIAASTMLGKGLTEIIAEKSRIRNKSILNELEWVGDLTLLKILSDSSNPFVKKLANMIFNRTLYKPVYRAKLVTSTQDSDLLTAYETQKQNQHSKGLFDPARRKNIESTLASKAKLKDEDVIVYCSPQAPGIKKIKYFVETKPGQTAHRDDTSQIHIEYMRKHLGLWFIYVFANPNVDSDGKKRLAAAAESYFSLSNDIEIPLRELQLQIPFD